MDNVVRGEDGVLRCSWSAQCEAFLPYHDIEWGMPVTDDRAVFEKVCLEVFQCGLNWRTILSKREAFRVAFDNFDFTLVAHYNAKDVERLVSNAQIVRNRRKIEAVIHNARMALQLIEQEGALATFFWRYSDFARDPELAQTQTVSEQSKALSKALRKRGWKFVGPTTMFALMQALGLINDHYPSCVAYSKVQRAQQALL